MLVVKRPPGAYLLLAAQAMAVGVVPLASQPAPAPFELPQPNDEVRAGLHLRSFPVALAKLIPSPTWLVRNPPPARFLRLSTDA
jgi:hypothetical protein